jgi:tetratricopeptide (TPR) repeat protein
MLVKPSRILALFTSFISTAFISLIVHPALLQSPVAPAQAQDCVAGVDCQRQLYRRLLQNFNKDLAEARQSGDRSKEVGVIRYVGEAHQFFGDFKQAIARYQQALALAREIKDRSGERQVLDNLAQAYGKQTPYGDTEFLEQEAKRLGDRGSRTIALAELASAYLTAKNYHKAIETFGIYLPLVRQDKQAEAIQSGLWNLAHAYDAIGSHPAAVKAIQEAIALMSTTGSPKINMYRARLAELHLEQGEVQQSLNTYLQILRREPEGENDFFWAVEASEGMAIAYAAAGDATSAYEMLTVALKLSHALEEGLRESIQQGLLDNISLTFAWVGQYDKAIQTQQQIAEVGGDPTAIFQEHLGAFYLRAGKLQQAETALRRAIAHYSRSRSTISQAGSNVSSGTLDEQLLSNFDFARDLYLNLQEVLIGQKRYEEALEVAEEGRARAFVALMASRLGIASGDQPEIPAIKLEQIKQVARAQNTTLVQYSIFYPDIVGYTTLSTFRLGQGDRKPSILGIWVIKPSGEVVFQSVDLGTPLGKQSLEELISSSRRAIGLRGRGLGVVGSTRSRNQTQIIEQLQQLYDLLIAPIASHLPKDPEQRVTFIPQDSLFLVPFAALQNPDGKYLIEQHTILTAPSIQVLQLTRRQRQSPTPKPQSVIVGNPAMPSLRTDLESPPQPLDALPGAEQEARAIAPLLNTQPLIGNQATEAAVIAQLPRARLIHLATHGILENLQGLQSALALTPSGKDDGFLTAGEVLRLKLNADLVVLSACDTGRGKISGDGVVGLSRSFIAAGASSVVVSLWAVPDAPTAALMTEFYRILQTKGDRAQALRQAMLITRTQHPNPRDWAAFTLIGEAE